MSAALLRRFRGQKPRRYAPPEGIRVYAIGDVHGCLDPLRRLLDAIANDLSSFEGRSRLVFLGDLVDRGPQSAGVVDRLLKGGFPTDFCDFIMGNHEEVMLDCYDGATGSLDAWLQFGGVETLESYGLGRDDIFGAPADVSAAMRRVIPTAHIRFLKAFDDYVRIGDYVFAHAGIRPGVPLEEQSSRDLRWIRRGFLDDTGDHGCVVVHGHTIVPEVQLLSNRIGVDTGCFHTGRLSAVVLESDSARAITVGP